MDQRLPTHPVDDPAAPECEIELLWRQDSPDRWWAVLTHRKTRRQLQATSPRALAGALRALLRDEPVCLNPDADAIVVP